MEISAGVEKGRLQRQSVFPVSHHHEVCGMRKKIGEEDLA
jgi:hypothetical protein